MKKEDALAPAAEALKAGAIAQVQARVALAQRFPRNIDDVRVRILKECKRPSFADAAIFSKPMGGSKIEGPSIRFAEAVMRLMGNLFIEAQVVSSDEQGTTMRILAMDLETNSTDCQDVFVARTVERKTPSGRPVLKVRRNSNGEATYTLEATDDEMLVRINAAVSKARRNRILALAPADIVEEAQEQCRRTLKDQDAKDPDAAKKRLSDAFSALNVTPADLAAYLGHALDKTTPAEREDLIAVYNGIKQGEATWADAMATKQPQAAAAPRGETKGGSKADRIADSLKGRAPGEEG